MHSVGRRHGGASYGKRVLTKLTGWALGSARGPKLAQLLAKLLPRGRPVGADVFAQLLDMTLEVELVLLEPGDIELLARGAALQLSGDVLFVITDDPVKLALVFERWEEFPKAGDILGDDSRRAHTLRPLRDQELALLLDRRVNVITLVRAVRKIVVGNIINFVLLEEFGCHDPRAVLNDLVDPLAVADGLCALAA